MNNTEKIMSHALPENTLVAHSKALEAAGLSIALVIRVPAPLKSIADQVIRSASSVPAADPDPGSDRPYVNRRPSS